MRDAVARVHRAAREPFAFMLGVLDLSTEQVETPELVADRIKRALPYVEPQRLIVAPDCGLKYLPRDVAFGKLKAMVDGARLVRAQLERV